MRNITLSVDVMGGDYAVSGPLEGVALFAQEAPNARFILHGDTQQIDSELLKWPQIRDKVKISHSDFVIPESMKAAVALRQGKGSSIWNALGSVMDNSASAMVSSGNTGALLALSLARLKRIKGVRRPALTALWPNSTGVTIVLDVGANLEADKVMLCDFARLGQAYCMAILDKPNPSIGILNVGSEDQKGNDIVREAALALEEADGLNFIGYVEGNSISEGVCDVVVTNGFTGNAALKAGEGVARLVASYVREALTQSTASKMGALLASGGLKTLKERMDPANVNAGVMLGLQGLVVKSHGGATGKGFATTLRVAHKLASRNILDAIKADFH